MMSKYDNRKTFEELDIGDSVFVINDNTQDGTKKCIIEYCVFEIGINDRNVIRLSLDGFSDKKLHHSVCILNSGQDVQSVDELILCSNFAALSNYIEKINSDYTKLANELILDRANYLGYKRLKK